MTDLITAPRMALPPLVQIPGRLQIRFLEFFTVNIRNANTRAAYTHAAGAFLRWCEMHGIVALEDVAPFHVAAYIEELGRSHSPATVTQHLAGLRMLFDWLVAGQALPSNPARCIHGPRRLVNGGATPVLSPSQVRALLDGIDPGSVIGRRDRAVIAVMLYTFARVSAVIGLKVEDYCLQERRRWLRLREKNARVHVVPCHAKLEIYLDDYLEAACIAQERRAPLFRRAPSGGVALSAKPMTRGDVYRMVRRRATQVGIETPVGCHSFRATGITEYLKNHGRLDIAQRMAGHVNPATTELYDRRLHAVPLDEVERITL